MPSPVSQAAPALPDLDDRLVASETRYEMLDGELVYVSPADYPHGRRHVQVGDLLEHHADPAFEVTIDMLTRTSEVDDFAPDVSLIPEAIDPTTGRHQLAHLVFEIVSTQTLQSAAMKAGKLTERGVRRVFAIDVERSRVLEWAAALATWSVLDPTSCIEDPALAVPLPIASLVSAARTDDAVARALLAKNNPVIAAARAHDREQGKAEGMIEALLRLLAVRQIEVDDAARARILNERDLARLERWIERGASCTAAAELFGDE